MAAASKKFLNGKGFLGQHTSRNRASVVNPGVGEVSLPLRVPAGVRTCSLCVHLHRCGTCTGAVPVQVCEHLGECGEPSQNHSTGFYCLPVCQPLPSLCLPACWSHLVLSHFNNIGLGPCPGPGREASLMPLPGDPLQADMAPGPLGAESRLLLNPPSALRRIALCQPSVPSPGISSQCFRDSQCRGLFSGSITASDVFKLK